MSTNLKTKNIYDKLLGWGIIILAVSATFSITLMNIAFVLFLIALIIKFFNKDLKYIPTKVDIPILMFLTIYLFASLMSPAPLRSSLKSLLNDYWYIAYMYAVVYLFEEKEMNKFITYFCWSAVGLGIYTVLQSLVGLNFNLNLQIGDTIKMVSPNLKQIFQIGNNPIYMGTGIGGQHFTFAGQMLMLMSFTYGVFRKKWPKIVTSFALLLSFVYGVWLGFVAAVIFVYFLRKKGFIAYIIIVSLLFGFAAVRMDFNKEHSKFLKDSIEISKESPLIGYGASSSGLSDEIKLKKRSSSIYSDVLVEGGIFTLLALLLVFYFMFKHYLLLPEASKGRWKKINRGCWLGLSGILFAGVFKNYLIDAENAVLFWTLAGLIIKINISKWNQPIFSRSDYDDMELFV